MTQQYVPVLQVLVLCTSTQGTGSVRTQYVHTPGQPVTHPPGFVSYTPGIVSCSFTYSCFTYIFDSHSIMCGSPRYHIYSFPSVPFIFATTG